MRHCPNCGEETTAKIMASEVDQAVDAQSYWGMKQGNVRNLVINGGNVMATTIEVSAYPVSDGYGGYESSEMYEIIQIGPLYFKKTGRSDSYGDSFWAGPCVLVRPKIVKIEQFEEIA